MVVPRARAALVVLFGLHAGVYGSWGPRLPAIKARLGIDDGTLGLSLAAMAVAMFAGTRIAGALMRRSGPVAGIRLAVPVLCGSLVGVGAASTLAVLVGSLVVMGLAMGLLDVAMNAEAVDVEVLLGRPVLGALHGSWSAGLLAAGAVAAGATAVGADPLVHLATVAALLAMAGLVATAALPPPASAPARPAAGASPGGPEPPAPARYRHIARWGVIAGCSFAAEGAATEWSAVYLHDEAGASATVAALGFAAFAVGMMLSRFGADRLVTRLGPVAVVRAGGGVAVLALGAALALPWPPVVVAGLAVLGAALAPVVPVVFRAAGGRGHGNLAWVVTVAYVGSIAGPALIGLVARHAGLRTALGLVVGSAAVIAALAGQVAAERPVTPQDPPSTRSGS